MRLTKLMYVPVFALVLGACANVVKSPTAVAGISADSAASVPTGTMVRLDGSKSTDPNKPARPLFYSWAFSDLPAGSHAALNNPHFIQPVFQADVPGTYTVALSVSNGVTTSTPSLVTVTATQCGAQAPTVTLSAMPMELPAVGMPVTLGATVADPDNSAACGLHQTLTWAWSLAGAPLGSHATLTNTSADLNAMQAPPQLLPDVPGAYTIALVVTDSTGLSTRGTLQITAGACGTNPPAASALTATPDMPMVNQPVALSATVTDADNEMGCATALPTPQTESYAWSLVGLPAGSHAVLNNPSAVSPTLTPDLAGQYDVRLVVTDSTGLSSPAQDLVVTVSDCAPMVSAISASPAMPSIGQTVQLSTDAAPAMCEGTTAFHYAWKLDSLPAGSHVTLNAAGASNPSFVPDVAGDYVLSVMITDDLGRSTTLTSKVTVSECSPAISSLTATPAMPDEGQTVQLTAAIMPGACESASPALTYQWSFVSLPAGSRAAFNDPGAQNPSFVADTVGSYDVSLTVTDDQGRTASLDTTISASQCGATPPVVTAITGPEALAVGQPAQLTATTSDADNQAPCSQNQTISAYKWSLTALPAGSHAALNDPAAQNPSFTPDVPGSYTVSLSVSDSTGLWSAPLSYTATVGCGAAVPSITAISASPTPSATAPVTGAPVSLSATIADADNDPMGCNLGRTFTYAWSLVPPLGSHATLDSSTLDTPSFIPDMEGAYLVQLTVTDSAGHVSAPSSMTITVPCGAGVPVVQGVDFTPAMPVAFQPVTLNAPVVDPDNDPMGCGLSQTFTYQWSLAAPAGSKAALNATNIASPTFIPDMDGNYLLTVVATDSTGLASTPVSSTITVSCGAQPPTASAITSAPAIPVAGQPVTLSATVTDPDNAPACGQSQTFTYAWTLAAPAGSKATLNSATSATPSFIPDVDGSYQVTLTVTDSTGLASMPLTSTFTVSCGSQPPTASAITTAPATPVAGQPVSLSATVTDPDNAPACGLSQTFTYAWTLAAPAGSKATLNSATSATPSFIPDVNGTYQVTLVATDSTGLSSTPATTTFTIGCGAGTPSVTTVTTTPAAPTALETVTLSAAVTDPDNSGTCNLGQTFTYHWSLAPPPGSATALNSADIASPAFIPDVNGTYVATVVATDSTGLSSAPASTTITIAACGTAPVVQSATANLPNPNAGQTVTLTAVGAAGDTCTMPFNFTYHWTMTSVPTGSKASLNGSTLISPSFTPDVSGTYVAQVTVSDQYGRTSAPQSVTVQAGGSCGNATPSASIYAPQTETAPGSELSLTGVATSADNLPGCNLNHTMAYAWSITSAPSGSSAQLSNATSYQAGFIPDLVGTYTVSLIVTDLTNGKASAPATVTLTSATGTGTCLASPSIVSVASAPTSGHVGSALSLSATGVTDGCGGTDVTYHWAFLSLPSGSSATLNDASLASPSFTADVAGTYQFALTVTNSGGVTSTAVANTVSVDVCGGQTPVAVAGLASPVPVSGVGRTSVQFVWPTAGTNFLLDGSASYDPDNQSPCNDSQTLEYSWELLEVPAGYDPTNFGPSNAEQPALNGAVAGTYVLRLRVSDGTYLSAPVYVTLSVYDNSIPGLNLTAGGWHRAYIDPISGNPRILYYDNTGFSGGNLNIVGCTQYCNSTTPVWSAPVTIASGIGTSPKSPPSVTVDTDSTDTAYGSVLVTFYDSTRCALDAYMCVQNKASANASGCLAAGDWPNNATLDSQTANVNCNNNDGAYSSVQFQYLGSSNANKSNYGYTVAYNETIGNVTNLKIAVCTADVQACFNTPSNLKKSYLDPVGNLFNGTPSESAGLTPSLVMQPKVAGQASRDGIAYFANGSAHELRYVECTAGCTATNSTWTSPVVLDSSSSDVGAWSSAALDGEGRVHIGYIDGIDQTLKYTRCDDLSCASALTPQTLDGPGNNTTVPAIPGLLMGGNTSLVLDGSNNPYITYFGTGYNPAPGVQYGGILRLASSNNGGASGSWGASTLAVPSNPGSTMRAGQANGAVAVSPAGNVRATYWDASTGAGVLRTLFLGN